MSIGLLISCMQPPRRTEPWKVSAAWWASQVCCVTVEEVQSMEEETEDVRFYVLANGHGENILRVHRQHLRGPPESFVSAYFDQPIVAFMEMRQNFWSFQPESWITYHVSTILEVDCPGREKLFILVERVDDRLEIMLGVGFIPRSFMLEFRATGTSRRSDKCFQQPRQMVAPNVTVRRFFEWVGTSLVRRWQPYHILQSNCQHVADEVQGFIRDPNNYHSSMELTVPSVELIERQGAIVNPAAGMSPAPATHMVVAPRSQSWEFPLRGSPQQVVPQPPNFILPTVSPQMLRTSSGPVIKLKNMPQTAPVQTHGENDECSIQ